MEKAMQESGLAAYMVIPQDGDVELLNGNASGNSLTFSDFIKYCNAELSKLILGQTMTTENGSSLSQAQIHKEVEEDLNKADMVFVENVLNYKFKQLLLLYGYKVENGQFQFDRTEQLSIKERLDIDLKLQNVIEFEPEYFYQTYNIPVPKGGTSLKQNTQNPTNNQLPNNEKKNLIAKSNSENTTHLQAIEKLYQQNDCCPNNTRANLSSSMKHTQLNLNYQSKTAKMLTYIAKALFNKKWENGQLHTNFYLHTAQLLWKAVTNGWKKGKGNYNYQTPDNEMLAHLRNNVFAFSAAKNLTMLQAFTNELTDQNGKVRTFSQFRNKIEKLSNKFNKHYLQTEYNSAIAMAQMAAQWKRYQEQASEFPYLQYQTVGDERVRGSHQKLNGTVLPITDSFWKNYYPPNGWGCRCDVLQATKEDFDKSNKTDSKEAGRNAKNNIKQYFRRNFADDEVIFQDNHYYYKNSPKQLKAEDNYGMSSVEKILLSESLPNIKTPNNSIYEFNVFFDKLLESKSQIELTDKIGDKIIIDNKLKDKLNLNKYIEQQRFKYANNIKDIIEKADEIWGYYKSDNSKQYARSYIKYFNNKHPLILIINEDFTIRTFYKFEKDEKGKFKKDKINDVRQGILLYRK